MRARFFLPPELVAAGALLFGATPLVAQQDRLPAGSIRPVPSAPIRDGFTLAAVGDIIYLRPMLATITARSPDMLRILRGADAAFGNLETSVIDFAHFTGAPQAESGGTWLLADQSVIADVHAMGFGIVSTANNHATDWGVEGLRETNARLDTGGIVHAGSGESLSAARAPSYLDIGAGRIALVAATSTFTPMSRAADGLGQVPARPGVNAIRVTLIAPVAASDLAVLDRITGSRPGTPVELDGTRYLAKTAAAPLPTFTMDENDEKSNLLAVRQAKQNGNFVIFSLHSHEPDNDTQQPPDFAIRLAHAAIDEGADVIVAHGPHQLRGIEIYRGRPIFYSLGNFAMMNNSLDALPADMYEDFGVDPRIVTPAELLQARNAQIFANVNFLKSVIAVSRYVRGNLAETRLYPLDLGVTASGAGRGVPALASPSLARAVLEHLQALSRPFGTKITIIGNVGFIRLRPLKGGGER